MIMHTHPCIATSQISIASYPHPLYVRFNRNFLLTCYFHDSTFVAWQHPSRGIITRSIGNNDILLELFHGVAQLTVFYPKFNRDEGPYTCYARTSSGQLISLSVSAELYNRTKITTPDNLVYEALQEDTATLSVPCLSVYQDELAWRKVPNPRVLTNSSDGHLVILPDHMVINNVRFSDNGSYECTVDNRVGRDAIIANIIVYGKLKNDV